MLKYPSFLSCFCHDGYEEKKLFSKAGHMHFGQRFNGRIMVLRGSNAKSATESEQCEVTKYPAQV